MFYAVFIIVQHSGSLRKASTSTTTNAGDIGGMRPRAAQHAPADKYDATPYVSRLIRLPHLVCLYRSGTAAGPADPARDPRRPKKTGRTAKLEEARSIRYV